MMMPANYSVISANEMVYVDGGAEIEIDLSTLGNNIVTIVGNSFISKLISSTLGVLFGGNYAVGGVVSAVGAAAVKTTSAGKLDILNTVLQFVGLGAATYQLTQKNVSPYATKIFTIEGTTK